MDVDTSIRAFVLAMHFMSNYGWTPTEPVIYPSLDACVSAGKPHLITQAPEGLLPFGQAT